VLRRIWATALMPWRDPGTLRRSETLVQLLDRGADQELLAEALRGVIFNAVSAVIVIIDEGYDPDAPDSAPGWTLVETGSGPRTLGWLLLRQPSCCWSSKDRQAYNACAVTCG
jgi:hypothetical protein